LHAACRGGCAGAIVVGGAGDVPFLHEWSAFAREPCMWRKIAATTATACSRERALLVHARLREQGVLDDGAGTQEKVRHSSQDGQRGGVGAGVRTGES
jgi:hypothetical protein